MEEENQDLDDLAAYESGFSIDERLAAREIAKILREKNFSYKQKSKVLHFVDKALYTVLINDCGLDKVTSKETDRKVKLFIDQGEAGFVTNESTLKKAIEQIEPLDKVEIAIKKDSD